MSKLKLGTLLDDKPIRIASDFPAEVHRDLVAYAEALGVDAGQPVEPARLVPVMVARFMATDRGFRRARRARGQAGGAGGG